MGENIEHALDVKVPGATSIDRAGTFSFTASASDVPRVHGYSALEGTFFGGCIFSGRAAGRGICNHIIIALRRHGLEKQLVRRRHHK
jgi:predicted oxidoreductase